MFRFIIFIYITFLFFKKIYSVIQKLRENHISTNKHFFEVQIAQEIHEKEQRASGVRVFRAFRGRTTLIENEGE